MPSTGNLERATIFDSIEKFSGKGLLGFHIAFVSTIFSLCYILKSNVLTIIWKIESLKS